MRVPEAVMPGVLDFENGGAADNRGEPEGATAQAAEAVKEAVKLRRQGKIGVLESERKELVRVVFNEKLEVGGDASGAVASTGNAPAGMAMVCENGKAGGIVRIDSDPRIGATEVESGERTGRKTRICEDGANTRSGAEPTGMPEGDRGIVAG